MLVDIIVYTSLLTCYNINQNTNLHIYGQPTLTRILKILPKIDQKFQHSQGVHAFIQFPLFIMKIQYLFTNQRFKKFVCKHFFKTLKIITLLF